MIPSRLTDPQIADLTALEAKATETELAAQAAHEEWCVGGITYSQLNSVRSVASQAKHDYHCAVIAAAPALLSELQSLRGDREALIAWLEQRKLDVVQVEAVLARLRPGAR